MREILVAFDEAVLVRLDLVAAGRKRAGFIRAAVEAALSGGGVPSLGGEVPSGSVSVAVPERPKLKPSGRGVDADRVIGCLRERRRSARDVANALKMDLATAGEVLGALVRDGVVRKRADKVLELVE